MFQDFYGAFGADRLFSSNMALFLAGVKDFCDEYNGGQLCDFYVFMTIGITAAAYVLKYHAGFDKSKYSGTGWWWGFACISAAASFLFVAADLWRLLNTASFKFGCDEEFIKVIFNTREIAMVAIVNAVLSFLIFTALSWPPLFRKLSRNCIYQKPF